MLKILVVVTAVVAFVYPSDKRLGYQLAALAAATVTSLSNHKRVLKG